MSNETRLSCLYQRPSFFLSILFIVNNLAGFKQMPSQTNGSATHSANIAANLRQINTRIDEICQQYHRDPACINVLAVSKTKPAEDIQSAFNAGQHCFGENYLQEALQKIQMLHELPIEWHFIGSIQSNKTRELAENFSWVHSVDRLKIARRLSEQRPESMPPLNICLQVNISEEASKSGFLLNELSTLVSEVVKLPNITLRGLMAIPAKADTLSAQRATFAKIQQALKTLQETQPELDTLSMGMSNDMEAAIAEGSTILRIGTAIFGARNYS